MPLALVSKAAHRVVPWRNGAGTTVELAADPPGGLSAGGGFLWRLSLAEVRRDGPFSLFPGVDRTLMLAEGGGLTLDLAPADGLPGQTLRLDGPLAPVRFPGDRPVSCRLACGPVRAFNLMVDRARARADLCLLRGRGTPGVGAPGGTVLLHVLSGQASALGRAVAVGETLVVTGAEAAGFVVTGEEEGTVVALVALHRRDPAPAA